MLCCVVCIYTDAPFSISHVLQNTRTAAKASPHSVFVGNLPVNTKRKTILNLFKTYSPAQNVRFRRNNGGKLQKSDRGTNTTIIAFVDFATAAQARSAVAALNNHKLGTNVLRVDVQAGSKNASSNDSKRTAFVGNLAYNTTDTLLRQTFAECGEIDYVRVNQAKKGCNGTAFVCFKEASGVVAALKLNGRDVNGRPVRINRSEKKQAEVAAKRAADESVSEENAADSEAEDESDDASDDDDEEEVAAPVVPAKKTAAPVKKQAAAPVKKQAAAKPKAVANSNKAKKTKA